MTNAQKTGIIIKQFRRVAVTAYRRRCFYAPVAELADAPDLGSGVFDVKVQVLSGAPTILLPAFLTYLWGISAAGSARHWQCRGQGFKSPMLHQIRTAILIQNCGSVFLLEITVIKGFLQKEKFRCEIHKVKIGAFSTGLYAHCSLRNFSLKNNAPLSLVF